MFSPASQGEGNPPGAEGAHPQSNAVQRFIHLFKQRQQVILDRLSPQTGLRWGINAALFLIYVLRVYMLAAFFIITYGLGIYLLNLLIGFLSPQEDPELSGASEGGDDDGPALPVKADDEFRPFIRRLPEFKFWYSCCKALALSIFLTFFSFLDLPVYWPILLIYFIMLFTLTMKRQIMHMIKYKYVPFNLGKKKFGADGKVPGASN